MTADPSSPPVVLCCEELHEIKTHLPSYLENIYLSEIDEFIRRSYPNGRHFKSRSDLLTSVRKLIISNFDRVAVMEARNAVHTMSAKQSFDMLHKQGAFRGQVRQDVSKLELLVDGVRTQMWRCSIVHEKASSSCSSTDYTVAQEMAFSEFLDRVRATLPEIVIPPFRVDSAIFIDPAVIDKLRELTLRQGRMLSFKQRVMPTEREPYWIMAIDCIVGGVMFSGFNNSMVLAERIAAESALIFFTHSSVPGIQYMIDNEP